MFIPYQRFNFNQKYSLSGSILCLSSIRKYFFSRKILLATAHQIQENDYFYNASTRDCPLPINFQNPYIFSFNIILSYHKAIFRILKSTFNCQKLERVFLCFLSKPRTPFAKAISKFLSPQYTQSCWIINSTIRYFYKVILTKYRLFGLRMLGHHLNFFFLKIHFTIRKLKI